MEQRKEAHRYKPRGRYGIDETRCRASVSGPAGWGHTRQCGMKAKHGNPPEWCGTHSPEAIERRRAANAAKYEEEVRQRKERWAREDRKDRLAAGAEKLIQPETWLSLAEGIEILENVAAPALAVVIAKRARKILGEDET